MIINRLITALFAILSLVCPAHAQDVVILGDSNTWIGADDCSGKKSWAYWFKEDFAPASCRSYARSGATWSNTPKTVANTEEDIPVLGDDNVIYNQTLRLIDAVKMGIQPSPDIIIIAAGTNDAWFSNKRPEAFSKTPEEIFAIDRETFYSLKPGEMTSIAAAVRYNCEMLIDAFPDARILLVGTIQSTKVDPAKTARTAEIVEQAGAFMGIPTVRADRESGIYAAEEARRYNFTYDGTHTSEAGGKRVGMLISNKMKSLGFK